MRISIQLIQNHALDNQVGMVLCLDNQQFLFNVCESYQRYIKEHSLKFQCEARVFLSRLDSHSTGGLYGLMLTMIAHKAGLGTRVYGPKGVVELFREALFLFWHNMLPYSVANLTGSKEVMPGLLKQNDIDAIVQDSSINMSHLYYEAIERKAKENAKSINDASSDLKEGLEGNGMVYEDGLCKVSSLVASWGGKECLSFLVETSQQMGKVQMDKCKEKGVAKTQIGQVMKGQAVMANGEWVQPIDLVDQMHPGQAILILDIPSLEVLDQLIHAKTQGRLSSPSTLLSRVVYLDSTLSDHPAFLAFVASFPPLVTHYYSPANVPLPEPLLYRHHRFQKELASILPTLFQTPFYQHPKEEKIQLQSTLIQSSKFWEDQLWPQKNSGYQAIKRNASDQEKNLVPSEDLSRRLAKWECLGGEKEPSDGRRVVFTGTGSMVPSTYRNVSGILVEMTHLSVVMDCGEGTFNQLADSFETASAFLQALLKVKVIFLTHIHCDHTLGTGPFILKRKAFLEAHSSYLPERDTPFLVYSYNTHAWIKLVQQFIEPLPCHSIFTQQLVPHHLQTPPEDPSSFYGMSKVVNYRHDDIESLCASHQAASDANALLLKKTLEQAHISVFTPIPVDHCPQSFALALEENLPNQPPFKICYSGDTRPCESLISQTKGYDVLIHECTYNDDKLANAVTNQHTTVSECLSIAKQNDIKWLYLTHFSQRYIKGFLHSPSEEHKEFYLNRTLVATDNMHVHSANIHQAVYMKNVLKQIATA